jgi:hypothetical protein
VNRSGDARVRVEGLEHGIALRAEAEDFNARIELDDEAALTLADEIIALVDLRRRLREREARELAEAAA